jgi:hypothetical protein
MSKHYRKTYLPKCYKEIFEYCAGKIIFWCPQMKRQFACAKMVVTGVFKNSQMA